MEIGIAIFEKVATQPATSFPPFNEHLYDPQKKCRPHRQARKEVLGSRNEAQIPPVPQLGLAVIHGPGARRGWLVLFASHKAVGQKIWLAL